MCRGRDVKVRKISTPPPTDAMAEPVAARHLYAFLTIAGLEELAIRALSAEDQLQDATALPVPEGTIGGAAAGVGAILVRTAMPLPPRVFESPVVCCSLAVVMQCELGEGEGLTHICERFRSGDGWTRALDTLEAHATVHGDVRQQAATFRVCSLRSGNHGFESPQLSAALGDAVSSLQPTWTVDLVLPNVCLVCTLAQRSLLIGVLLPPLMARKSDSLPAESRTWLTSGVERPHMRPSRAALLVRLLAPRAGDVLVDPCGGIGLIAIEAAMYANLTAWSIDLDEAACDSARDNAASASPTLRGTVHVLCADSGNPKRLALPEASIDVAVADLPFGMLHEKRLDVGRLLCALAKLLRPGGRCLLVGNSGKGGVAAAVVKAGDRFPRKGAWALERQTALAAGGIACTAVELRLVPTGAMPDQQHASQPASDADAHRPPPSAAAATAAAPGPAPPSTLTLLQPGSSPVPGLGVAAVSPRAG